LIKNFLGKQKKNKYYFNSENSTKYYLLFFSLLIARAEDLYDTYVDKRKLGHRLDPNKKFLSSEFNSILLYDDIHLPNRDEDIIFTNHTWNILSKAFSNLFHNETIQLLSRYHYQTAADVLSYNKIDTILQKNSAS